MLQQPVALAYAGPPAQHYNQANMGPPSHASVPPMMARQVTQGGATFYAGPGGQDPTFNPYRSKQKAASGREVDSYFVSGTFRREMIQRSAAAYDTVPEGDTLHGLTVERYGNLVPLQDRSASRDPAKVFQGLMSTVYRAVDTSTGNSYALRRLEAFRPSNTLNMHILDVWRNFRHPNIVGLQQAFTSNAIDDTNSLFFVYEYFPCCQTLEERLVQGTAPADEASIWSIIVQIVCALRGIHSHNLAARVISASKILIHGRSHVRINCLGMLDIVNPQTNLQELQYEDLVALGRLVLVMACRNLSAAGRDNVSKSIEYVGQHYSPDLQKLLVFLLTPKPPPQKLTIYEVTTMMANYTCVELESRLIAYSQVESECLAEMENGRLFRLITKLGFVNERPEFMRDHAWAETGDRYILKLFRDYVFHQVDEEGRPVLEWAHVVETLNKLDIGSDEQIMLVSRNEADLLVVSYRDIRNCLEKAIGELIAASRDSSDTYQEDPQVQLMYHMQ